MLHDDQLRLFKSCCWGSIYTKGIFPTGGYIIQSCCFLVAGLENTGDCRKNKWSIGKRSDIIQAFNSYWQLSWWHCEELCRRHPRFADILFLNCSSAQNNNVCLLFWHNIVLKFPVSSTLGKYFTFFFCVKWNGLLKLYNPSLKQWIAVNSRMEFSILKSMTGSLG